MATPRLTINVLRVLSEIADCSEKEGYSGSEISKNTRLASGTLYPILLRLEAAGWLNSKWEKANPSTLGRPRKRHYKITGEGRLQLSSELADDLRGLVIP